MREVPSEIIFAYRKSRLAFSFTWRVAHSYERSFICASSTLFRLVWRAKVSLISLSSIFSLEFFCLSRLHSDFFLFYVLECNGNQAHSACSAERRRRFKISESCSVFGPKIRQLVIFRTWEVLGPVGMCLPCTQVQYKSSIFRGKRSVTLTLYVSVILLPVLHHNSVTRTTSFHICFSGPKACR